MNIRFIIAFIIPILFTTGCRSFGYIEKPSNDFLDLLNAESTNTDILFLNGLYQLVEYNGSTNKITETKLREGVGYIDPMYFYGNNVFTRTGGLRSHSDSWESSFFVEQKDFLLNRSSWGVYKVKDSIIYAIAYIYFVSSSDIMNTRYLCYFTGKIKNKSRIEEWQMIPPYPLLTKNQAKLNANISQLMYLKAKKTFVFQKFPIKTSLDSNKVWINKFKTNN